MAPSAHDDDHDDGLDDGDVDGMIGQVMKELPGAAKKYLWVSPELEKNHEKNRKQRERHAETKRKRDEDRDASGSQAPKVKKPRKKQLAEDASDDDDSPVPSVTYYIEIPMNKPTKTKSRGKAPVVEPLQRGPFTLPLAATYASLIAAISRALPCRPENIHETKIRWKPKKPKNANLLPLGKSSGYAAMVTEFKEDKKTSHTVILLMPPPAQPMDDEAPWATGDDPEERFDYGELDAPGASDSVQEQKNTFNKATRAERDILEDKYPIGNYPNFPQLRVYCDPTTKFYFELNSTRLDVWAAAMAKKETDENNPPSSRFFDANQRIKIVPAAAAALAPNPNAVPLIAAAPPALLAAAPPAPLSLSDLLMASILSQSGGGLGALFPQLNQPAAPQPREVPVHPRSLPPSPIKRHTVSTERFCEIYEIDADDCGLLKHVGFRPGDVTAEAVEPALAKEGFTIFSWKRVHHANLRFKADLRAGMFD
ncbi:hypothetical protein DFH09DRAFT_1359243 [Mycena vulgaris]|nr:hypothetical protein DFH09DRAFT_1359243 [Mycena vulgaris]